MKYMISVTGDCDSSGTPRGAYVVLDEDELRPWLDDHGYLEDGAKQWLEDTFDGYTAFESILENGLEWAREMVDRGRSYAYHKAVLDLFPRVYVDGTGLLGRAMTTEEVERDEADMEEAEPVDDEEVKE